jgi:predicted Zn finger-like uncharacterized protein
LVVPAPPQGFTQCPGCYTLFRVDRRQLAAADGQVRCGLCGESFDAEARLADALPADLPRQAALIAAAEPRGRRPETDTGPPSPSQPGSALRPAAGSDPAPVRPDPYAEWRRTTALDVEQGTPPESPAGRRWPWLALCLLLAAALAAQLVALRWDALARDPDWRSWLSPACEQLGCELPPMRQPDAVEVVSRLLREHPAIPGALLLTATLVNRADEPQPWPQLGLVLSGLNGATVARHWFDADSYLRQPPEELMPTDTPVAIRVMFRETRPAARSFEIRFR